MKFSFWVIYKHTNGRGFMSAYELAHKYNILPGGLHSTIAGRQDSHKGWQLYSVVGDNPTDFNDSIEEYHVIHPDFGKEVITCRELSNKYPIKMSEAKELITGKRNISKGWRLFTNKDWKQSFYYKLKEK